MAYKQSDGQGTVLVGAPGHSSEEEESNSMSWCLGWTSFHHRWECSHQERDKGKMGEDKG